MKNKLVGTVLAFSMILGLTFSFVPQEASASPCPTGYSSVSRSWFSPSNDTFFTMCGCQVSRGYAAQGSCAGAGPQK